MARLIRALAISAALLLGFAPSARSDADAHLLMGNPSQATADPRDRDNFLIKKPYFALSYHNSKGTPNWVSWRLTRDDLGDARRVPFYPDEQLPRGFKRVLPRDYTGSGFDRSHMCPHSDRGGTSEASAATFAMTNIVPQSGPLNQKAWNSLEIYCRGLVEKEGKRLYIVCGPQGTGGVGTKGPADTIARGKVNVPAKCWKIILVLPEDGGENDMAKVTKRTRVIAVVMPNDQEVGFGWAHFRTSVKKVEELTGYTFFDKVPADIAGALKEKVDEVHIPRVRPPRRPR